MKPKISNLFVVMWFVGFSVKYAFSIKCYECESFGINSACSNGLDSSMIKTCPYPEYTLCFTMKMDFTGGAITKRACYNQNNTENNFKYHNTTKDNDDDRVAEEEDHNHKNDDLDATVEEEDNVDVEIPRRYVILCNSDLCNGAFNNFSTKMILFISAMLSLSFCGYD